MKSISRRKLITGGIAVTAGAVGLTAADKIARRYRLIPPDCGGIYGPGETLTYAAQRLLTTHSLAREFPRSMISASPFANPAYFPDDALKQHQSNGFRDWKLAIDGMVAHPASFSLSDIHALGLRSQITEVACEEGWSYVAEWIGTPLFQVLNEVGVSPQARYIVYFSIDKPWWESIDMADALHPQTFLTMGMNDGDLPVSFGGPLRLRVPRALGYKSVKYITPHDGYRFPQELRKGPRLGQPRSWLLVVRRHLRAGCVCSNRLARNEAQSRAPATPSYSRDLTSRMGGWPKNRLYSRLNWLALS